MPQSDSAVIKLPAELAVEGAGALQSQLLEHVDDEATVFLDAADIARIHTAALQLFCLFCRDRRGAGRSTQWLRPSPALRSAAALLGVTTLLALGQE